MRYAVIQCLILASLLVLSTTAYADTHDCCCANCGCACRCQKVCRLVCEEKKVEIVCWGCKCEEFCVPGHSLPDCQYCKMVCGDCDEPRKPDAPYALPKKFVWNTWCPGCAEMYTRKKLMKKVVTEKVPSYKWVVEDLCPQCVASCERVPVAPGTTLPRVPASDATLIYGKLAELPIPNEPLFK